LETPMTSLQMLEARGVSLFVAPSSEDSVCETDKKEVMSTEKYIGSSAISIGGLLKSDLSPIDLSTLTKGSLVSTIDIDAAISPMMPKLSSASAFQAPADKITKVMPRISAAEETSDVKIDKPSPQTMVLIASQTSNPAMFPADSPAPMLKSLEWASIEEVNVAKGATVLCKQESGFSDVANGFFLMETK